MAIDKISLYNNALLILGQRKLDSITEDRAPRHDLDTAYDLGAVDYCLEIVRPTFASLTDKLTVSVVSTEHDLDNVFTLPTDFITVVGVYSDAKLDQEITRYIIEDRTLACEYATIYLRYTSNARALADWSPSFARVVAAFLARETAEKLAPGERDKASALFVDRVEAAIGLEREKEPDRSAATTVTLTNSWRHIYNDALMVMGLEDITANDDDSNRRSKLDRVIDAGVVADLLEDTGWTFALDSTKIYYDPSISPSWGYDYAMAKPPKLHRIEGLFQDEHLQAPLKDYVDEGGYFFTGIQTAYIQYVSTDFLTTPDEWPSFFKRMVAGRMAKDAAPSLKKEGADPERADKIYEERKRSAESNDAMSSPPRRLAAGNWVKSRFSPYRGGNRGRP